MNASAIEPADAVLEQLEKVLSSPQFQGSERSMKLLRFVVEHTLRGESDRLKEYTLGMDALGKGQSFDPRVDPIVRSEMSRLRTRLEKYYLTEGRPDPIVIVLPKGSYAPRFEKRAVTTDSAPAKSRWLGWTALGLAAAAGVLLLFMSVWWRAPQPTQTVSVAVIPFANVSADATQEFFSDGITDEIASALARVPSLRIVARSSAYTFKNQTKQAVEVGQALGATHLIEGSVRVDGSRFRITAQLIEARSGLQVWSETYERNVSDVFATQEEIAQAIAHSLRLPLGLHDTGSLVRNRTADTETYDQYLRAKALVRTRGLKPLTDATALLENVVARDPAYAPAWAVLAIAYEVQPIFEPAYLGLDTTRLSQVVRNVLPKADAAARKAVALDPSLPEGYAALAHSEDLRGHLVEAEDLYLKALALNAETPDALHYYADLLAAAGRLKEAFAIRQRLQVLEPFVPIFNGNTAAHLWLNGQTDAAIALVKTVPDTVLQSFYIPMMQAAAGRHREAARSLTETYSGIYPRDMVEAATHLLLHNSGMHSPPKTLPPLGALWWSAAAAGHPSELLTSHEAFADAGYSLPVITAFLWHPAYAEARKTERFKVFMRKVGIVAYWHARGWPEFCRALGSDDFVCE